MNLQQQSPEWFEMRRNHIGASDAPIIMEISPWKNPIKLWEEKLNLSSNAPTNWAQKRGLDLEENARLEFEKMTGLFVLPKVIKHPNIEYLMASLDGMCVESKNIVEIKCAGKVDHAKAMAGEVPEHYFPQLQHQLEVTELDMVHYFSFDGEKGVIVKVYRDDDYIRKMLNKEKEFWECVQTMTPPKSKKNDDFVIMENDIWEALATEHISLKCSLKELGKKLEINEEALLSMSQNRNCCGSGIFIAQVTRKGAIDLTKIQSIEGIDLEPYRKPPTKFWTIKQQ